MQIYISWHWGTFISLLCNASEIVARTAEELITYLEESDLGIYAQ